MLTNDKTVVDHFMDSSFDMFFIKTLVKIAFLKYNKILYTRLVLGQIHVYDKSADSHCNKIAEYSFDNASFHTKHLGRG